MTSRLSALLFVALVAMFGAHAARADSTWVYAVQISATAQSSPPRITLSWPQDTYGANSYTVYRKTKDASSWGTGVVLPGSATSYIDNNVAVGAAYEYQIVKAASQGYSGYGYIYAGIEAPLVDTRGKVILVVDNTQAPSLATELARLEQDLAGDGWTVVRRDVSRTDSPANVRNIIRTAYNADPANTKAVFLFGHIPILRSGGLNVDGHGSRKMPADGFYGDMDGTWNDPSTIPSDIELMVGRVDLFDMPVAGRSETELLRNYLNKDHNWRHKRIVVPRRALIGDRFGTNPNFPETTAASGFRNFEPFVGPGNIVRANEQGGAPVAERWTSMLSAGSYLWAFGCGAGSYTSMSYMGTHGEFSEAWSSDMIGGDPKAVFFMMFGSWFGEWDSRDNLMRAALASPTMGLTCSWSGRPHWYYQHMGLGEPIGYSARLTQNNSGLYRHQANPSTRGVHIALMGDPTLRMHPVAPPSGATVSPVAGGKRVAWNASADATAGYHVYRSASIVGPFSRLTGSPVNGVSFTDTTAGASGDVYMVRAIKLENTPSGTFYNASQGAFSIGVPNGGDTIPPVVTVLAPTSTVSGPNVEILAIATDNVGVAGVQFQINGVDRGAEDTSAPYVLQLNTVALPNGVYQVTAIARDAAGNRAVSAPASVTIANTVSDDEPAEETVWFDDALPSGANADASGGDSWSWVTSPVKSGAVAHQSTGTGDAQHFFNHASQTLVVNTGDVLMAYVYLDPANPPQQVMLQWNDGSWEHRAYWGASLNTYGVAGTQSRRAMGPLPALGQWVRLEVPAALVGLEGKTLQGMAFTLYGGRATWDRVGKLTPGAGESIRLGVRRGAGGLQLTWNSQANSRYRVQSTSNLRTWTDVQTVTATGSTASWTNSSPSAPQLIYRVVAE